MIEPNVMLGLLVTAVLYVIMLTVTVVRGARKWKKLLEQKEQELKRCKMELKAVRYRRV